MRYATPTRYNPVYLRPGESPSDHPCASMRHYEADQTLLDNLLHDLRSLLRRSVAGETTLHPYQTLTWYENRLRRRVVICDPASLLNEEEVCIVGFLGNRRATHQANAVDEFEIDVISEFRQYPGILSYSSTELTPNQWANLVVHQETSDLEAWRRSAVHIEAAEELSPHVYHSVRIHNGRVRGGLIGRGRMMIETTKYWDYDSDPMWHAIRTLPREGAEKTDQSQ